MPNKAKPTRHYIHIGCGTILKSKFHPDYQPPPVLFCPYPRNLTRWQKDKIYALIYETHRTHPSPYSLGA